MLALLSSHSKGAIAVAVLLQSVQSLGGAQRLKQQQQMLLRLSGDAATQLAAVQQQLQSQLQLLQQQRQQQREQQKDTTADEGTEQQQQLIDLQGKTQKLLECTAQYTAKLQVVCISC